MKKRMAGLLAAALLLSASGCGAADAPPEKAADGSPWGGDWITVGGVVGVDTPDGMDPRENNEALAANGMYYATWSVGEGEPYTNEDGGEAEIYDAQIYLLLGDYKSAQEAESSLSRWKDMARLQYVVEDTGEQTHNGQDFTVITYTYDSGANPYSRGASAFGVYRNCAVSVEVACRQDFDGEAGSLLGRFLDSCHYAAP